MRCVAADLIFEKTVGYAQFMPYTQIINAFKGKRVLVVGDLILDRYLFGKVNRISPEAPVPIVDVISESFLLGGAANVANNVIALGGRATVAGIIGKGNAGKVMQDLLAEKSIDTAGVIEDKRPTTVKTRVIAHNQQVVRFDKEERRKLEGKSLTALMAYVKKAVPEHDAVVISDYNKGVVSAALVGAIMTHAKKHNTFVAVDPKVGHFHFYKNVSLITPNLMEAAQGSGVEIRDEKSLMKAGKALISRLGCKSVLITRSEDGMSLFKKAPGARSIMVEHFPTVAKKVFDVTGAGDTVIAAFALAVAAGASLEQATVIANHAAGIVVGEVGTATASPERLLAALKSSGS
ncbi:MAG TPA: D-glycero-beta-D-manno-heptose-7-phosphate kinase [Dissulfurispiraceae bacterium]|nr:D-glycero-beta-D-manno-heptose-7-phosphate kinase [Dissulfurispiraceae bacterium]